MLSIYWLQTMTIDRNDSKTQVGEQRLLEESRSGLEWLAARGRMWPTGRQLDNIVVHSCVWQLSLKNKRWDEMRSGTEMRRYDRMSDTQTFPALLPHYARVHWTHFTLQNCPKLLWRFGVIVPKRFLSFFAGADCRGLLLRVLNETHQTSNMASICYIVRRFIGYCYRNFTDLAVSCANFSIHICILIFAAILLAESAPSLEGVSLLV